MSHAEIIAYYDQTYENYRIIWGTDRHFSLHYGFYDKAHKTHDQAVINMIRVLADLLNINADDRVLDAGCGIGGSGIWLAENRGAQVVGVNINEMQIKVAKQLVQQRQIEHLTSFIVGDFINTQLPAQSFDVIWGLESICYAADKKDFLCEAKRLLKPGGRLVVADGFQKKADLTHGEQRIMDTWLNGWVVPNLAVIDQFHNDLQQLDFSDIQFIDIKENTIPSSKYMYRLSSLTYPIARLLRGLGYKIRMSGMVAARSQYIALRHNLWTYGIFSAVKK